MAMIVRDQAVDERFAGHGLQPRIERGADREPSAIELVLAEVIEHLAAHFLGEVLGGEDLGTARALDDAKRLSLGGLALLLGGKAILDNAIDDPVASGDGTVGKLEWIVVARPLGQRGKIGAISQRQLIQGLVPIGLRRRGHTIGAYAEINFVEIEFENLLLGEGTLDADGEDRLLQFALEGLIAGQKK